MCLMVSKGRRVITLLPSDLNKNSKKAWDIIVNQHTSGRKPRRIALPFPEVRIHMCFGIFPIHAHTPQTFFLESLFNLEASEYKVIWTTTFSDPILSCLNLVKFYCWKYKNAPVTPTNHHLCGYQSTYALAFWFVGWKHNDAQDKMWMMGEG